MRIVPCCRSLKVGDAIENTISYLDKKSGRLAWVVVARDIWKKCDCCSNYIFILVLLTCYLSFKHPLQIITILNHPLGMVSSKEFRCLVQRHLSWSHHGMRWDEEVRRRVSFRYRNTLMPSRGQCTGQIVALQRRRDQSWLVFFLGGDSIDLLLFVELQICLWR